jgi:hypothetical protein
VDATVPSLGDKDTDAPKPLPLVVKLRNHPGGDDNCVA